MGKIREIPEQDVPSHPAVTAWREVSPNRVAGVIVVKKKGLGAVFGLHGAGPGGTTVIAKQCDRTKGIIERAVYQEVLPRMTRLPLACYGVVEQGEWIWLFLEDVGGVPYSPDEPGHREAAARWIGELHTVVGRQDVRTVLPERGAECYRTCLASILQGLPRYRDLGAAVLDPILSACGRLESSWEEVETLCEAAPETLVHGDCLAKNLHIRDDHVAAFDWGGAGWGRAATDLGQLALPRRGPPDDEPDCEAYLDVVRRRWPRLDVGTIRQLATLGQLFWALKVISRGIEEFERRWRDPQHILADFRVYGRALARSTC